MTVRECFQNIAIAIKNQNSKIKKIKPKDMAEAISKIPGNGIICEKLPYENLITKTVTMVEIPKEE